MQDILLHWSISGVNISPIDTVHQSSWDIDGKYILKHNKNAEDLKRSIKLFELLSVSGIPIAGYIKTIEGKYATPDGLYCLMLKLPGSHIDFDYEPQMIVEFGKELAKLHIALLKIESQIECNDNDYINEWHSYIKLGLINIPDEIIDFMETRFFDIYRKLLKQLIHRDVHSQNVLFENGKLTGWLDFDLNCHNARIFDIAYLLGGLLCNKTENPDKIMLWEACYHDFIDSYDKVNPLYDYEKQAIPLMILAIELLFVSFWNNNGNEEYRNDAALLVKWLYYKYR